MTTSAKLIFNGAPDGGPQKGRHSEDFGGDGAPARQAVAGGRADAGDVVPPVGQLLGYALEMAGVQRRPAANYCALYSALINVIPDNPSALDAAELDLLLRNRVGDAGLAAGRPFPSFPPRPPPPPRAAAALAAAAQLLL